MDIQLICPQCGNSFPDSVSQESNLTCSGCGNCYQKEGDAWDFRIIKENENTGWDAEAFDKGYAKMNYYEDAYMHAANSGIPAYIEDYRLSRVKDAIAPWITEGTENKKILDVGCGHGWYVFRLFEKWHLKSEVYGIDISPFNINLFLKELKNRNREKVFPFCANAESIPVPDNYFDLAFFSEVLEHVESPDKVFQELSRVLKPGALLIITTPSGPVCTFWEGLFWLPRKIKHLFTSRKPSGDAPYDVPLSFRKIKKIVTQNNFSIEHYHKAIFLPHESFIQFFPDLFKHLLLYGALFLEKFGRLTMFLGLHHIIKLRNNK